MFEKVERCKNMLKQIDIVEIYYKKLKYVETVETNL